jgi:hypothetical protein
MAHLELRPFSIQVALTNDAAGLLARIRREVDSNDAPASGPGSRKPSRKSASRPIGFDPSRKN